MFVVFFKPKMKLFRLVSQCLLYFLNLKWNYSGWPLGACCIFCAFCFFSLRVFRVTWNILIPSSTPFQCFEYVHVHVQWYTNQCTAKTNSTSLYNVHVQWCTCLINARQKPILWNSQKVSHFKNHLVLQEKTNRLWRTVELAWNE